MHLWLIQTAETSDRDDDEPMVEIVVEEIVKVLLRQDNRQAIASRLDELVERFARTGKPQAAVDTAVIRAEFLRRLATSSL